MSDFLPDPNLNPPPESEGGWALPEVTRYEYAPENESIPLPEDEREVPPEFATDTYADDEPGYGWRDESQPSPPGPLSQRRGGDAVSEPRLVHYQPEVPVESSDFSASTEPLEPLESGEVLPFRTPTEIRIDVLTESIGRFPDAVANYVLRGELYLATGGHDLAAADFTTALALSERDAESLDWGYINAAYTDRAREGLRRIAESASRRVEARTDEAGLVPTGDDNL